MKDPSHPDRRRVLKMLGAAPMLPVGSTGIAGIAALLSGSQSGASAAHQPATFLSAEFISMPAPTLADPQQLARTTVESAMDLVFSDGSRRRVQLGYEAFFMTGDAVPDGRGGTVLAGGIYDIHGAPILDRSVRGRTRPFFSDCPDGMSLLTLDRSEGEADGATGPPARTV